MKLSEVLIKPILTEKANAQQEKLSRYAFKVARKANKLEIKKAVEEFYGVTGYRCKYMLLFLVKIKPLYKSWCYHQAESLLTKKHL